MTIKLANTLLKTGLSSLMTSCKGLKVLDKRFAE